MQEEHKLIAELLKSKGYQLNNEAENLIELLIESVKNNDDVSEILNWLEEKRKNYQVDTQVIGINQLDKWNTDHDTGNISHESGKFFKVIGVKVAGARGREVLSWTQPMVHQQECGILGILCKKLNGIRHYLIYAKYEPGNTNKLQLSPTLQATESNLKLAHGGKKPLFAEYFEDETRGKRLVNVVSVEDGGRFYLKTNRNMVVEVAEDEQIEAPDDFIWLTLPQLKKLLKEDNVVNSLVRSVLGSW